MDANSHHGCTMPVQARHADPVMEHRAEKKRSEKEAEGRTQANINRTSPGLCRQWARKGTSNPPPDDWMKAMPAEQLRALVRTACSHWIAWYCCRSLSFAYSQCNGV